ncbi:MAG TPA: FecR domain-containing protein, partial [Xanthobacteraceae bacterium]
MLSGSRSDFGVDGQAPPQFGDGVPAEAITKIDGAVVIPDASLLFSGDFKRSGLDLEISHDDRHFLVRDYFRGEHRAGLASPDGAWLTGDIVNALTGHTQFAQADGSASVGKVIGHVTKLAGNATVIRNGVSIILNLGDNVEKGDVVQSGSDSKLGITFIDGSVFGLASNARMVLNEMIYDPNGSSNSSLLSLVAGTITFVAGQTAKHGDMKVDTPVATMGIRGTAVLVQIDFLVPQNIPPQNGSPALVNLPTAGFQVLVEPDGTTGSYVLLDKTTQIPLATVDRAGQVVTFNQGALGFSTASPLSAEVQQLITDVFALKFTDANPKTLNQFTDSIIPDGIPHAVFAGGNGITPTFSVPFAEGGASALATYQTIANPVHYDVPPTVTATPGAFTVRSGAVQRGAIDSVSGAITFEDVNVGDRPTAKAIFVSFKVLDAQGNDITATLTAKQLAAIAAVEVQLTIDSSPGNSNIGSATWSYSVADRAFDFLGSGRTLVLTYNAQVDTNYSEYNTSVLKPFTITISSPHVVEWIFPSDGLWSIGSNWKTGLVPTGLDDVVVPAQEIVGGTGHYAVTIITPAEANAVSLDAADTTGAQLINNSTLTINNALTLFSESAFHNFGVAGIGLIELLDQSSLDNSGLITLAEGGDFA